MKFSIVTPVYNGEQYIAETLESILSQEGDFEIEYVIADGASTDGTLAIVKSYDVKLKAKTYPIRCNGITFTWFSEKDAGMYDAIEKGFARSTGDVMAYMNADDVYLPGAFATVAQILQRYADVEWVKGINMTSDETGAVTSKGSCFIYRQSWLQRGIYGRSAYFVQQDSVFWRRSLWEKPRPALSPLRLAGDYGLWKAFAARTSLWSFNKRVSVFRKHAGQLSSQVGVYRKEQETIVPHHFYLEKRAVLFFSLTRFFGLNPKGTLTRLLFFILFPLHKRESYIDFDTEGKPVKKFAVSYIA